MKKIYLLFLILFAFTTSVTVAQNSHDKISYQSVVRDGSNHLLYDTQVTVTVSIKNSGDPAVKYSETHTVTSNANGLISFLIGAGNNQNGNWNAVQWNHADITLVTSVNGTVLSTHTYPLSAVPYALYAKNADTAIYADSVNLTVVKNFIQSSGYLTDELQVLSISNDTIYLSKGGWVKLPAGFSGDYNDLTNKPDLKPVATSGDYNDLVNKPENLVQDANYVHTDNNYTTAEKNKLAGIEAGAEVNVQSDWEQDDQSADDFIKNKPTIPTVNDGTLTIQKNGTDVGTFTANQGTNATVNIQVPAAANDAKLVIKRNEEEVGSFTANASVNDTVNIEVPTKTSELTNDAGFITASDIPDIPGAQVQSDWTEDDTDSPSYIQHKPTLAAVATSGSYNDLSNTPTIPTVNDGTLTIQKNGTNVGTFTANQATSATVNIDVPAAANDATIKIVNGNTELGSFTTNAATDKSINIAGAIPTVNDGTLTIQKNGTNVGTFTANQGTAETVNIEVPTVNDNTITIVNGTTELGSFTTNASAATSVNIASAIPTVNNATLTIKNGSTILGTFTANADQPSNVDIATALPTVNDATLTIKNGNTILGTFTANADQPSNVDIATALPTVNDATLTIKRNGTEIGTFTANQGTAETVNIEVPTVNNATLTIKNGSTILGTFTANADQPSNVDIATALPTVNDATLTIKRNGTEIGTFTANQGTAETVDIEVPTVNNATLTIKNGNTILGTFTANADQPSNVDIATALPTVNDATLTIKRNGTEIGTFTANQGTAETVNIEVPTVNDNTITIVNGTTELGSFTTNASAATSVNIASAIPTVNNATLTIKNGNTILGTFTANADQPSNVDIATALPTVNDATLTIKRNGTEIGTFTANQGTAETVNIEVPTVNNATLTIKNGNTILGTFTANADQPSNVDIATALPTVNDALLTIKQGETTLGTFTANASDASTITVPAQVQSNWNETDNSKASFIQNKPNINNATLTIQKNGTDVGTFTANQATDETVNILVPAAANDATITIVSGTTELGDFTTNAGTAKSIDISSALPTVNDARFVVKQNGTQIGSFTANASVNDTVNILVPAAANDATITIVSGTTELGDFTTNAGTAKSIDISSALPTVNDARFVVKQNGTQIGSFTANASVNDTVNILVPAAANDATITIVSGTTELGDFTTNAGTAKSIDISSALPTVNDAKFVVKQNGTQIGSFTANASVNDTVNIEVPAAANDATITIVSGTTNLGDFTTNAGTAKSIDISSAVSDKTVIIQKNGVEAGRFTLNQNTDATINLDHVAVTNADNSFSGKNHFNDSVTVPSNTSIPRPVSSPECNNLSAVNVCDLLAVFDSLRKRIDSISLALAQTQEELEELKNSTPPTVSLSLSEVHSNSLKATATANGHGSPVTSFQFCISENSDMSNPTCSGTITGNNDTYEYTFENLTGNKEYYVTATATNVAGTGTDTKNTRTPAHAPTATLALSDTVPAGFTVNLTEIDLKEANSGTITVCYKEGTNCPADDATDTTCIPTIAITIPDGAATMDTAITITGLTGNTDYCVFVTVSNADSSTVPALTGTVKTGASKALFVEGPEGNVYLCGQQGSTGVTTPAITYTADIVGGDTADFTYVWSTIPVEGASISSESAKCTIVYSISGTFQVRCEATPKTGVSGTVMEKSVNTVVKYGGIVPLFTACKDNLDVTILSRSNAPILDWGDETVDSADTHTYTKGTYTITATSDYGCVATQTVVISEGTPPCHVAAHRSDAYQNNGWQGANDGYETISDTNANYITSVTDYDGNVYPVVQIGSQCWLAENMRCVHSPSTTSYLVNQEHKTGNAATKNPYAKVAHWYNNDETYAQTKFGLLYNWCAAVDTYDITQPNEVAQESLHDDAVFECELPAGHRRGICPKGWHVPTSSEWTEMEEVVNGGTLQDADWGRGSHAGKLSAGCDWHFESCMDNAPSDYKNAERSLSGFNALPAGRFSNDTYNPIIDQIGLDAYFWTCESDGNGVIEGKYFRRLEHSKAGVLLSNTTPAVGMSVRCVRDEESGPTVMQPTVTTDPAAGIDDNHATLNATINDPDAVGVDEQGFVWKPKDGSANDTIKNADLTDNHFTASLTNLTPGTRYQYWAYIIYNGYVDTTYSATKEFLTTGVAPPSATLTVTSNVPVQSQLTVCDGGTKAVTYTATVAGSTDLTSEYNYSWSVSDDMQYSSHENTCTVICTSADENYTLSVTCTATPKSGGTPLEPFTESSVEVVSSEDDNIPMFGTCEDGLTVTLQYWVSGNASIIRWGDDSQEEYDENDNICIGKEHQYASAGTYTITTENESTGCSWTKVVYVGNANPCTGTPRSNETGQGTAIYSVKDIEGMNGEEGHEYQVVQIGSQCWMAENLRTTKFPPVGDSDPEGIPEFEAGGTGAAYYYNAENDFDEYSVATYGLYYNSWAALNGYRGLDQTSGDADPQDYIQGICPEGWHIPSKSEWIVLKNELKFDAIDEFDDPAEYGAGKLSGGCDWEPDISGSVDDAYPANYLYPLRNVSGFSALPAGLFEPAEGDDHFYYYPPLEEAWFWSSSYDLSFKRFYAFVLKYADEEFDEGHENENAISVRCLRNDEAWEPFDATLSVVPSPENTVGIGTDVTYTASMSGTGDFTNFTYLWVVDGNVESEGSSNTFTYTHTVTGTHTISCTATKGIYSVQASVTTTVDALTITSSQSSFNLCPSSSQTITYTATPSLDAVDRYTYSWSDGTNTLPSTGSTCTVTYNSAGTYSVSCTATHSEENYSVTGIGGVSATSSVAPSFTYAVDTTSVIVKRISANTSITNWGGGGTEGGKTVAGYKNTVYTYNASGIYDITATTTEGCTITRKVAVGNATLHPCAVTAAHPAQTGLIGSGHETPLASSSDSIISVTDVDGNVYDVVQIGTQCWLKSNLRTRNFSDGTAITNGTMAGEGGYNALSTVSPYYYRPPVNVATPDRYFRNYIVEEYYDASGNKAAGPYTEKVFGLYYNWPAVMSEHGICPQGWHVPTEGEWNTMIGYVVNEYGAESGRYAYLLTEGNDWNRGNKGNNGTPGSYDSVLRNASEFSAIVTGFAGGSSSVEEVPNPQGKFFYRSFHYAQTYFWSSSTNGGNQAVTFNLKYTDSTLLVKDRYKNDGYSVRCVRDADGGGSTPVTTAALTITPDEANPTICGAGSATVTYTASVSAGTTDVTGNYTYEWSATGGNAQTLNTGTTYTVTYTATGSNYSVSCTATPTGDGDVLSETFAITVSLEPSCLCTVSNPGTNEVQNANGAITAVTDVQNHTYKVVKIGSQCWMAENMRSTVYSDPSGKPTLTELPASGYTSGTAYYGYPNSESQNVETYGLLYNWKAAMGGSTVERAQGICPDGWHVPTSDEIYAMGQGVGAFYGAAGKLAGGESGTWMSSDETAAPGNYAYSERNSSGFGVLPAGHHEPNWRNEGFHENALIWTSKEIHSDDNADALNLSYNIGIASVSGQLQTSCLSVRCVRNGLVVTTSEASNIGDNSATLNATITNPENKQITEKGFQWKLTNSSDDFTSHTVDVNSAFTLTIDTLSSGSNYVCRAFVSTADGTFYGKNVYFETTGGSEATFACGDALKDNDYDNNSITYATVDINGRCWMAENLRSTKYASNMSGVPQQLSLGNNSASASIYYPGGSAENVATYGLLYNKSAAYGGSNTSGDIQGICPEGWHVPSKTEFETAISNSVQSLNNKLAGCYSAGQYSLGTKACYWTSTQGSENPYVVEIFVYGYISYNTNHDPEEAMSVRCVKDE